MEDKTTAGGPNTPSEDDLGRLIRSTVDLWQPRRGADWSNLLARAGANGPPAWVLYTAASAALIVILLAAFLVGSYLQLGALGPQPVQGNLH